jgi:pseudouridine kinase
VSKHFGVVGASCTDIFAASSLPLIAHDSNPGTVRFGHGGVGRNIAENLARLEQNVQLFAAFGSDPFSLQMLDYTRNAGVDTGGCLIASAAQAPYYIAINDPAGELSVAVNDMAICERITPEYLSGVLLALNACDAVVLDTNIPKASIDYLTKECSAPLLADSVSVSKAVKLSGSLPSLFALNTNLREAQALLNTEAKADLTSLINAADRFHASGVAYVLITLGAQGAFLSNGKRQLMMSAYPAQTVNANGCGDAFSAAAFVGILNGEPPESILQSALAAAAITAQSAQSVSELLSPAAIRQWIKDTRSLA